MNTAFLFVGQGSQAVGMGTVLAQSCEDCRATFAAADCALGFPLTRFMAEGPDEELRRTALAQPAILVQSVAEARHLIDLGAKPRVLVGHSLGQYSALVMAGSLKFEDAVRLVAERGRLIQKVVPEGVGSMYAIVGIDRPIVYEICQSMPDLGVVQVACHNAPNQTVISGEVNAVEAAVERLEDEGAGAARLSVSAPFHCRLLMPMMAEFKELVQGTRVSDPELPVVDNVTARPLIDAAAVRASLIAQVTSPVLFEESLRYIFTDLAVDHVVQCGPSRTLLNFARKVAPQAAFETFESASQKEGIGVS